MERAKIMTVEANTEVYKGYSIEVAIDAPPLDTWRCRITDPQGRLFAECPGCNSRVSAFIVAEQIIDADITYRSNFICTWPLNLESYMP